MIQYQILQTNITRIVWQTERRITNEILGVMGSYTLEEPHLRWFEVHLNFILWLVMLLKRWTWFLRGWWLWNKASHLANNSEWNFNNPIRLHWIKLHYTSCGNTVISNVTCKPQVMLGLVRFPNEGLCWRECPICSIFSGSGFQRPLEIE